MDKIKLSELDPRCLIIHGNKNELACSQWILGRIYNSKRLPKKLIAIANHKNYEIEIDVKKDDIVEGFKCWVCDKYLGESEDAECPDHKWTEDENLAPEYIYILKSKNIKLYDKVVWGIGNIYESINNKEEL